MLLCEYCIQAIRSRGVKLYVGEKEMCVEETEESNTVCAWCGEHDDLYDCKE